MVSTTITFSQPDVNPPVYVAGSFSDWQPIELDSETIDDHIRYSKKLDVSPGNHQFKFRLGPGDWWVTDEGHPIAHDESGNLNNVLEVKSEPEVSKVPEVTQKSIPKVDGATDSQANGDVKPYMNGSAHKDQPIEKKDDLDEPVTSQLSEGSTSVPERQLTDSKAAERASGLFEFFMSIFKKGKEGVFAVLVLLAAIVYTTKK